MAILVYIIAASKYMNTERRFEVHDFDQNAPLKLCRVMF